MLGSFQRTLGEGYIVYRGDTQYHIFDGWKLGVVASFPRTVNMYQNRGQLKIFLLATRCIEMR